jgi:prefoldin subunit 5
MTNNHKRRERGPIRKLFGVVFTVALMFGAWWVFANQVFLVDWWRYRHFEPPAEIVAMAQRTELTDTGRFRAFSSEPALNDAAEFNANCPPKSADVNVLGCYDGRNIFIFRVTEPALDGIEEVTLVHEMLHAQYARLTNSKRDEINRWIDDYVAAHDTERMQSHMANYSEDDWHNELHSIIGTEYTDLSPELLDYYNTLFDYTKVLELFDGYHTAFAAISARAEAIHAEADALAQEINSQSTAFNSDTTTLNAAIEDFNRRAGSGYFETIEDFNSERRALMIEQDRLEALRTAVNQKIERYNALAAELQQLQVRSQELNDSINSQLQAVPSL